MYYYRNSFLSLYRVFTDISVLKLKVDKCSQQDNLFMKKHSQRLYRHIFLATKEENSSQQHFESLYMLLGLICIELANEEVVVDLIRLALALQVLFSFVFIQIYREHTYLHIGNVEKNPTCKQLHKKIKFF